MKLGTKINKLLRGKYMRKSADWGVGVSNCGFCCQKVNHVKFLFLCILENREVRALSLNEFE